MNLYEINLDKDTTTFMYLDPKMKGGLARRGKREQVKELQEWLNDNNYDAGPVDGIYGSKTAMAVKKFQKDAGLTPDGDAGRKTILAMMGWNGKKSVQPNKLSAMVASPKRDPETIEKPLATSFNKEKEILNIIAKPESSGNYDAVYPGKRRPQILTMTLSELFRDMRRRIRTHGGSASGRYQYIYKTLRALVKQMGLDPKTTVFDAATQDKIALFHLKKEHNLDKFLDGQITSEKFLKRLSKTWAGLPDPSTGQSYYLGLGDNKANVRARDTLDQLDQLQTV